jgi:hypothetical protein
MTQVEVAHADAVLDLIEATGLTVYRGKLPPDVATLSPPWVLVYTAIEWPGEDGDHGLDQASSTCIASFYCYCAGTTDTSVLAVTGRVRTVLVDVRPAITGRVCNPIDQVSSEPARPHEGTGNSILSALSIYELRTRPS